MSRLATMRKENRALIKDNKVLRPNYIPKEIVGREEELDELSFPNLHVLDHGSAGGNTMVHGRSGMGKTMCVQSVLEDLKQNLMTAKRRDVAVVYTHSQRGDRAQLVRDIITQLDPHLEQKVRRQSDTNRLFDELQELCIHRGVKILVLAIDEVHLLGTDLDFILSKFTRKEAGFTVDVQLYLISNNLDYKEKLPVRVASALDLRRIVDFKPYTVEQLAQILQSRASLALTPSAISAEEINHIAAIVAKHFNWDARAAITLLAKAAEAAQLAGSRTIEPEHVEGASEKLTRDIEADGLMEFSHQERITLAALWLLANKRPNQFFPLSQVFQSMCVIYRAIKQTPPGVKSLKNYLDGLEQVAAIRTSMNRNPSAKRGPAAKWYGLIDSQGVQDMMERDDLLKYAKNDALLLLDEKPRRGHQLPLTS